MKIVGLVTSGNGRDGVHIAGGAVQMENVTSFDNGGAGVRIAYHPDTSLTNLRSLNNVDAGLIVEQLQDKFPALKGAPDGLIIEAAQTIAAATSAEREAKLAILSSASGSLIRPLSTGWRLQRQ